MLSKLKHHGQRKRLHLEQLESRQLLSVNMTPEEQLMLELVNRARADPVAEIERNPDVEDLNDEVEEDKTISPDPKQPLAPHQALIDAMRGHVRDMMARNYFGHDSPEGSSPSGRARSAGYPTGAGENIAWTGNTQGIDDLQEVYDRHQGLVTSVGHRINMMRESWREVGPAVHYGNFQQDFTFYDAIMVGTLFGNRRGNNFITGVAITDHVVRNSFYEVGEGLGNVTITATRNGTDETYSTDTGASGGYSLQVPNGTYTLTAEGGRLVRKMTVRGVVVDSENVKIDFNNFSMPTRFIAGQLFDDLNADGILNATESVLVGRTVYLDLDDDEELDDDEPTTTTDASGNYFMEGLLPGDYTIRQVVPRGWAQTSPSGTFVIPIDNRNIIGVDFGSRSQNTAPIAADDFAAAGRNQLVSLRVARNDVDADDNIDGESIRIETVSGGGTARPGSEGQIEYTSHPNNFGVQTITYTIADTAGLRSAPATVHISIVAVAPFQNQIEPMDVDGNGVVVSRDVLHLVREINLNGSRSLVGELPDVESPLFYDVNGDNFLSSIDALRIIQFLNRNTSGSGEPPPVQSNVRAVDEVYAVISTYEDESDDNDLEVSVDA